MANTDVIHGDCLDSLSMLPDNHVHCVVTSPPYFGLRDYGHDGQIGLEQTPDEYVAKLVAVFREVRRVLRPDGTLWLNLGDSYSRSPGKGQHKPGDAGKQNYVIERGNGRAANTGISGLPDKQLLGIPWRVAFALQADGWYLRQDIIWHKPNPMPESVRDRCTKAHEYIFLLAKSERYYFDSDAVKEPSVTNDTRRPYGSPGANKLDPRGKQGAGAQRDSWKGSSFGKGKTAEHQHNRAQADESRGEHDTINRNRRSVWTVATKPFKGAHFATFPPDLIEPCVLAGAPVGGVVLDPFGGAGTTGMVANRLGRRAILMELNEEYCAMAKARIAADVQAQIGML